jgi:hypothetical protein
VTLRISGRKDPLFNGNYKSNGELHHSEKRHRQSRSSFFKTHKEVREERKAIREQKNKEKPQRNIGENKQVFAGQSSGQSDFSLDERIVRKITQIISVNQTLTFRD